MIVNLVYVWVKEENVSAFIAACRENARSSRREPGVAGFDVLGQADDPARFVLIESFRDEAGPAAHKETAHYKKWRETVAPMMQEDRKSLRCIDIDVRQ
jgi:(4S)-4-hydroxy-5-phosphonooxypentane-2,3-dione isomerase